MAVNTSLLSDLVSIDSLYLNEQEIGEFLSIELEKIGMTVKRDYIDNERFNILAERGESNHKLLFYGHMDTVGITNKKDWETNPYELTIKENKAYGLGAYDMKAGISAILEVLSRTVSPIKVLFAVDEENISKGAWSVIKNYKDFFNDVELVISVEPNFGNGIESVTNQRTGRCIYQVDFHGRSAHIAMYKEGVDAIKLLGNFINNLYEKRESLFISPDTVVQVRKVHGESVGMSVCGEAMLEVEAILGHEDSIEDVRKKLSVLTECEVNLKERKTPYLQGYKFNKVPYQKELEEIINKETGNNMKIVKRSSVGDDNVLATLNIPVITWGPSGGNAHSANEFVDLESLNALTNMFTNFVKKIY